MLSKKAPNPIDKHVGSRVRMRRMLLGMSQEKLGEALGLTFQQVQKYEKGTNRIGASRLQQISSILGVPVDFFFEGAPGRRGDGGRTAASRRCPTAPYVADFLAIQRRRPAEPGVPAHPRPEAAPPRRRPGARDRRRRRSAERRRCSTSRIAVRQRIDHRFVDNRTDPAIRLDRTNASLSGTALPIGMPAGRPGA